MTSTVTKTRKVRIGKQVIGRIDTINGDYEHRAFIADPELGFREVAACQTFEAAVDAVGNAIMHKLWEAK